MKGHDKPVLRLFFHLVYLCLIFTSFSSAAVIAEPVQKVGQVPQQQVSPPKVNPLPKLNTAPAQKQSPGAAASKTPAGAAVSLPDLQVNRVFIAKPNHSTPMTGNPTVGDKVDVCCEYTNAGQIIPSSSTPWNQTLNFDGQSIVTGNGYSMISGQTYTWCQAYNLTKDGIHQVECVLDTTNKIAERNEANNKKSTAINIATTDLPMAPGAGVNLRITDLSINNNDGRVIATVRNFGPSAMSFDAKIRLRRDNVLIKECVWPKNITPMICSTNMLVSSADSGPEASICNWGKGDYDVHAEIITESGQPEVDKTGKSKRDTLRARQDLFAGNFYEDANGKLGIIIGNKGPCYATPWSYKFYIDGTLKETGPVVGGLMRRNGFAHVLLVNQAILTQPVRRQGLLKFEVLPQYPEHEQTMANNSYQIKGISPTQWGFDFTVTDMVFLGQYRQETYPMLPDRNDEGYFRVLPIIKNIGTVKLIDDAVIKFEFYIDNVSQGELTCHPGLAPGAQMPISECFYNEQPLPIVPVGSHSVRFVINTIDTNILNNHFVKTMVRP